MTTTTTTHLEERVTRWNSVIAPQITKWCPESETSFTGSGNTCPHCRGRVDKTHWKWWSPEESTPVLEE